MLLFLYCLFITLVIVSFVGFLVCLLMDKITGYAGLPLLSTFIFVVSAHYVEERLYPVTPLPKDVGILTVEGKEYKVKFTLEEIEQGVKNAGK